MISWGKWVLWWQVPWFLGGN